MKIRCIDDAAKTIPSIEVGDVFELLQTIEDPEFGRFYVIRSPITRKKVAVKASRFEEIQDEAPSAIFVK